MAARTGRGASRRSRPPAPTTTPPRKRQRTADEDEAARTVVRLARRLRPHQLHDRSTRFVDRGRPGGPPPGCVASEVECQSALRSSGPGPAMRTSESGKRPSRHPSRVSTFSFYAPYLKAAMDLCLRAAERSLMRRIAHGLDRQRARSALGCSRDDAAARRAASFAESVAAQQKGRATRSARYPIPPSRARSMRRLSAAPHHLGLPRGREERRMDSGADEGVGARRAHRDVRRPLSRPRRNASSSSSSRSSSARRSRRRNFPRTRRRARRRSSCRPTTPTRSTATSRLRSSTSTTACPTTTSGSSGSASTWRQDRHRALWRRVAGHQAQGRGREGGGRLHHLLRSAGRRILRGRGLPAGTLPPGQGVQRGSVADMPVYPGTRSPPASARRRTRSASIARTRRR